MPDPNSCPCGAHPTDPDGAVTYITDALIEAIFDGVLGKLKYIGVIAPFVGNVVNVGLICSLPKPRQPEWTLSDFVNPETALAKAGQMLYAKIYELNCTCDDCPPATACGSGTCIAVGPDDGFQPDPDEPGVRSYLLPTGSGVWVTRSADGDCLGFYSGLNVTWHIGGVFDPANGVSVCSGTGGGCRSWSQNVLAGGLTVCFDGAVEPPPEPIPEPPDGVDDWYGPAPCTDSDICVVLDEVAKIVRNVQFLTTVIAGPLFGVTAPYTGTFPGIGTPITGQLSDWLPRALAALAPVQPVQLVTPTTLSIDESGIVELDGEAYMSVTLITVPDYLGFRGDDESKVYHFNAPRFAPGWLVVIGQNGVLAYHEMRYGEGLEFAIPATATSLAVHLSPGVEVEITTWSRQV